MVAFLELGNYTSDLRGEEGEMWFWAESMKDGSLDHTTQDWGKFFSFHDYTFKHDSLYSINNWMRQVYIKIKMISISTFVSIWFYVMGVLVSRVERDIFCDSGLSGICHSAAFGEIVCPTFPQCQFRPSSPLSAAQSALCSRLWVGPVPSTHITVKTTKSQTHSGIPMCKYTYTLLDQLLNPLPTVVQKGLWGNPPNSWHLPLHSRLSASLKTHVQFMCTLCV